MKKTTILLTTLLTSSIISANAFAVNSATVDQNLKPSAKVVALAEKAYHWAAAHGDVQNHSVLTVIDFSLPSYMKRGWIIDRASGRVLKNFHVAQGKNTGDIYAQHFSNQPNSLASSPGIYTTGNTYSGKHGFSLRLNGLEPGINDNAAKRAIVVHAANYMSSAYIHKYGRAGRSWGCFALAPTITKNVIQQIKGGSVIFAYKPGLEKNDPRLA